MKVVINGCYGGFSLSDEGMKRYCEIKGMPVWAEEDTKYKSLGIVHYFLTPPEDRADILDSEFYELSQEDRIKYNKIWSEQSISDSDIARDDPALVQVVEELCEKAYGRCAELKIGRAHV